MIDHNFVPSFGWVCVFASFMGIIGVTFFLFTLGHLFKKRSRYAVSETIKGSTNTDQYDENFIGEWTDGLRDIGTLSGSESKNAADGFAMADFVRFIVYGHGNIVDGSNGPEYDRPPLRKVRMRMDADFQQFVSKVCSSIGVDGNITGIQIIHRHPYYMPSGPKYVLMPIVDDECVEDLLAQAKELGAGLMQELFVQITGESSTQHVNSSSHPGLDSKIQPSNNAPIAQGSPNQHGPSSMPYSPMRVEEYPSVELNKTLTQLEDRIKEEVMPVLNLSICNENWDGIYYIDEDGDTIEDEQSDNGDEEVGVDSDEEIERTTTLIPDQQTDIRGNGPSENFIADGYIKGLVNQEVVELYGVNERSEDLGQRSLFNTAYVLLDDVEQTNQLGGLAADLYSYAPGSRIIFVRRGKGVIGAPQARESCAFRNMQLCDALVHFCMGALRGNYVTADYVDLSVTSNTGRLPLALKLVACFLSREKNLIWEDAFKNFKAMPYQGVEDLLRIGHGTLYGSEKQIFVDIACFFIGTNKRIAFQVWEDGKFLKEDQIAALHAMSSAKIKHHNELWMRGQLVNLPGGEIVWLGNYDELVTKRMICFIEEPLDVNVSHMGTAELEAIHIEDETASSDNFSKSSGCHSQWTSSGTHDWNGWSSLQMAHRLKILVLMSCRKLKETPNFSWFPLLEKLGLEHCRSLEFVHPSIGSLKNLISLSVKYCLKLKELPQELGSLKALTELCIDGTWVKEIPPLKGLKMLAMLSARKCRLLSQVPSMDHLTSLVELQLDYSGVCQLPDSISALAKLKELHLSHTPIHTLPDSIGKLHNLEVLKVNSSNIMQLPSAFGKLEKLKVINASSCKNLDGESFLDLWRLHSLRTLILDSTNIRMLPENLSKLSNLQTLDLTGCDKLETLPVLPKSLQRLSVTCKPIVTLPNLSNLVNLEELQLLRCETLVELPSSIGKLSKLKKLSITHSRISVLPEEISTLSRLHDLAIRNCKDLQCIPQLPTSLNKLEVKGISAKKLPNLSHSADLLELRLSDCSRLEEISGLGCLTSLRIFSVIECTELTEFNGLEKLESLRELHISECDSLDNLPDLSKLRQLHHLVLSQCTSLKSLPGLSGLKELRYLDLSYCMKLEDLEGLEELELLQTMDVSGCKEIEVLPSLSRLRDLKVLSVRGCDKLRDIRGLEELQSQLLVYTHGCTSLQNISHLLDIKIQG